MSEQQSFLTGWHLDKRLSVGHIITTLAVAGTAFWWLADIDKRVDLNSAAIRAIDNRQISAEIRQAQATTELKEEIRAGFDALRQDLRAMTSRIDGRMDKP